MIQPTRVLPSNAPPLQQDSNVHQASRVLQEHAGNRQGNHYGLSELRKPKFSTASPILTENPWPRYEAQPPQHLYHPQPQSRQQWTYGGRHGYGVPNPEDARRVEIQGEALLRRFQMSSPFKKYRERQRKDKKTREELKWPDHLEESFIKALVRYPPMGRHKHLLKDKQRGRNELIADYIREMTGEGRDRKQISSHIQVLKPYVKHDPYIMRFLATDETRGAGNGHGSGYTNGRRLSNYPVPAPLVHSTRNIQLQLPQVELRKLHQVKGQLNVFEPNNFEMFVQRKYRLANEDRIDRLHTYTQSLQTPLGPDLHVDDWQVLNQDFPFLASMHKQRPLDCNIVIANASLAFPMDNFKDQDGNALPGVELGISFSCSSRHLPAEANIKCHNSFYRNGHYLPDHSGPCDVHLLQTEDRSSVETQVKFGSTFWARTLAHLAARLKEAPDIANQHKEDVQTFIQSINAVQEVVALSDNGHERILIIFWAFRQSSGSKGRTSWRKLVLPPSSAIQSQYPEPRGDEHADSMSGYDTLFADASTSQPLQQTQPGLQSPFEYDNSSGSALSSATWPTSLSDGNTSAHPDNSFSADNTFDFTGGNINIAYDPTFDDFSNFDSSALNFDGDATDFATDPALQQYSQYWCDPFPTNLDTQTSNIHAAFAAPTAQTESQPPAYNGSQMEGQAQVYSGYEVQYDQPRYMGTHEQQAYGGAGLSGMKEDDPLAALADASYLASSIALRQ